MRLIDSDGAQIGVRSREEAMDYAWGKNLDLVEVAPDANPPVCRVMDYSKYKYEQEQKQKLARKHQSTITIKEIKLRPKIDPHDYATKKGHVVRFLKNRDKVKVTIMFRGREMTHPERGRTLLLRLADDVKELGIIESEPLQDGRNMVMMLAPVKEQKDLPVPDAKAASEADGDGSGRGTRPGRGSGAGFGRGSRAGPVEIAEPAPGRDARSPSRHRSRPQSRPRPRSPSRHRLPPPARAST